LACRLFLGESFPDLQRRLWLELESACGLDPLAVKWLVVSNRTLAHHIRLKLSRRARDTALAGIRVLALPQLLARLTDGLGLAAGSRWHAGLDLLLCQLTSEIPAGSPLARLQQLRNGFTLLRPVLLDLADSGFGNAQLETLTDLVDEDQLRPPEKDVITLYLTWLLALQRLGVNWTPLVEQRIPEALSQCGEAGVARILQSVGRAPKLFLYGFYDFTDNAAQILAALSRLTDLKLFFPYSWTRPDAPHPAFTFVRSGLEDLKTRIGPSYLIEETISAQDRRPSENFFLSTFPAGAISDQPEFLTFQRASGLRAEVLSAAVRIRRWLDEGLQPENILLLAPDAGPYLGFVEDAFAEFAIPLGIGGVTSDGRPAADATRMLGLIWKDKAPAEWILAYFREYPDAPVLSGVDLDAFEKKTRLLAISGGEGWVSLLKLLQSEEAARAGGSLRFSDAELSLIRQIVTTWVFSQGEVDGFFSQSEARRFLGLLQQNWLTDGALLEELLQGLEYAAPRTPIPITVLQDWFISRSAPVENSRMDRPAVLFIPMMRARGITAEAAVILGLAAGRFPFRIEEDPFLSDRSRAALARKCGDLGHRLPVKSKITEEMKLLFQLLNSSVEQVHWVIPETDETGRTVAPTPWVQRYLRHWEVHRPTGQSWPRIPRGPAEQARLLHRMEPESGSFLPPSLAVYADPGLLSCFDEEPIGAHLLEVVSKRDSDPAWNGLVPEASFVRAGLPRKQLRVTDLETLARCPFRFYSRTLLGATPLGDLESQNELDPLTWGSILHALLEAAMQPLLAHGASLREIADLLLRNGGEAVDELILSLPADLSFRIKLLPPLFARDFTRRLLRVVEAYLESVQGQDSVAPVALEARFIHPFPGVEGLEVSGQIDRIDQTANYPCVVDYKSGKKPRDLEAELRSGYRLQPILYPWLYSQETGEEQVDFAYIFLAERPPAHQIVQAGFSSEEFFAESREILARGAYLCFSKEAAQRMHLEDLDPCRYCDYISLCRRFESTAPNRAKRFFERFLAGRLERLKRAIPEGDRP
jgi:RecB family exonuclease